MLNSKHKLWLSSIAAPAVTLLAPHVAFASVGAGAGLPYEDTFSKIVTSLTGPWAWTVAIVCVVIFAYNAIQRGGDLGGSTMAFLGPAFICTLLLGAKKLMTFFGQGALLVSPASMIVLVGAFTVGIIVGVMMLAPITLQLYRSYRKHKADATPATASASLVSDTSQLLLFAPSRSDRGFALNPLQPSAADHLPSISRDISVEN
jgi:type IV secretion system protein TrbC